MSAPAVAAQIAGEPEKTKSDRFGRKHEIANALRFVLRSGCLGLKGLNAKYLEAKTILEMKEKLRRC